MSTGIEERVDWLNTCSLPTQMSSPVAMMHTIIKEEIEKEGGEMESGNYIEQVNGSLLPASVVSIYCAYVCYAALSSEPTDYACNHLSTSSAVSFSNLILGMLTIVLSILYSALRVGSSSTFLSPPSSPRTDSKPLFCS